MLKLKWIQISAWGYRLWPLHSSWAIPHWNSGFKKEVQGKAHGWDWVYHGLKCRATNQLSPNDAPWLPDRERSWCNWRSQKWTTTRNSSQRTRSSRILPWAQEYQNHWRRRLCHSLSTSTCGSSNRKLLQKILGYNCGDVRRWGSRKDEKRCEVYLWFDEGLQSWENQELAQKDLDFRIPQILYGNIEWYFSNLHGWSFKVWIWLYDSLNYLQFNWY